MAKASVKSDAVKKYAGLSLAKLEAIINDLQTQQKALSSQNSTSPTSTARPSRTSKTSTDSLTTARTLNQELSIARYALQQRQRQIKAQAMEFERGNTHHLLFFQSTNNFVKLADRSAIFFAVTIADRIHWRYSLKADTDRYSPSADGVISFRSLQLVAERLAEINIFPDHSFDQAEELYYFLLPKVYTDEQIAKFRDNLQRDLQHIMSIVLPTSPIPTLYDAIMQANQILYFQFKHLSDSFAREVVGKPLVELGYQMSCDYLCYARTRSSDGTQLLLKIVKSSQDIRFGIAYLSKLQILHHRETCQLLEQLIAIERIANRAYARATKNV